MDAEMKGPPLLLSLSPAAALAGISPTQLDKLRKSGVIFALRLRRKHKFRRSDLLDLCGFRNTALPVTPNPATKPVR